MTEWKPARNPYPPADTWKEFWVRLSGAEQDELERLIMEAKKR